MEELLSHIDILETGGKTSVFLAVIYITLRFVQKRMVILEKKIDSIEERMAVVEDRTEKK